MGGAATTQRAKNALSGAGGPLHGAGAARDKDAESRSEVAVFENPGRTPPRPKTGRPVPADDPLYGHGFGVRARSRGAETIRRFLDQDSGLGAFAERVAHRPADAGDVRSNQDRTGDARTPALTVSRERFRALEEAPPEGDRQALRRFLIKEALTDRSVIGHWQDRWRTPPFPSMSAPEQAVCSRTD